MFNIKNFEILVGPAILKKGSVYFTNGNVTLLEEEGNGIWSAEVEGSETYFLEITINGKGEITDHNCDCPYDGGICKHVVAVLFKLRKETDKSTFTPESNTKKKLFETLLKAVTHTEYQKFVREYALQHKSFKTEFELFFANKDSRIDVAKKYGELVSKVIKKHSHGGYVDYRASFMLSGDIEKFVAIGEDYIKKNNFRDAFALCKAILNPILEVLSYCDDSNGDIGDTIDSIIDCIEKILSTIEVAIDIKEAAFEFLLHELQEKDYFDYGDFGYHLFSVFKNLSVQLDKGPDFLAFTNLQISDLTGPHDSFRREFYNKEIINFLVQTGKAGEAEKLVEQNMDIVSVRMEVLNKAIAKADYAAAKKIIAAGIKIAQSIGHPGTVDQWNKHLLRVALLEKDIDTIRYYTKYFAFVSWFSTDYYKQWKKTYTAIEWKETIEKHIAEIIKEITGEWNKNKHKQWEPKPYPPLLQRLGDIYILEKYWERLFLLVQEKNDLNTTLTFHEYLIIDYSAELLAIYLPALFEFGVKGNTRTEYEELVRTMRRIIKDIPQGKKEVLAVAQNLKEKFSSKPRRPAMIQELDAILK